ncbi:Nramp family divalent metal transporter [Parasphingorhabdus flavimaris]|jgi:manganese transport protein|uniref:Nramp family divalent metal transporter n=1 Tax=Parasphingorhabdus flavimaris TaxID=266812 RepID=A0ABX2N0W6_9SPHN|nr:Nramp family divalent metal transporter [Parasphingorhabdus flavimaris]NVD27352.1 Nramp family divalent metal transporter [Parasphingorhabdus flavimaris]|tara:strand:+ start:1933 stop:3144 length:1212 start_codon:yes stop_codon:yes gene_type:complete
MKLSRYRPGPGMMVSAAFIGPGTVTACTLAGANFGFALLWALVFATITTIILQSFAVRIALVTQLGLAEAMLKTIASPIGRILASLLLISALVLGNAAYEAGNMSGAALGLEAINGGPLAFGIAPVIISIALFASLMLVFTKPKWIENILIALVMLMSLAFLLTFLLIRPDLGALLRGFIPSVPDGGLMTAIALIGTTIVPYNLFLHAASVRERWDAKQLPDAQLDTTLSIGIGGLVSMTILATAAASLFGSGKTIENAVDMAQQLTPLFGSMATFTLGAGLFAAGLTSAITAPLATGYIVQEIFKSSGSRRPFQIGALIVIISGTVAALSGYRPVELIFVAQIANGLLLPIVALFLLKLANDRNLLGQYANGLKANILGVAILLVTTGLGFRLIARALGFWP